MMKNWMFVLAAMASTAMLFGCSDDSSDDSCTNSEIRCKGDVVQVCNNGNWENNNNCEQMVGAGAMGCFLVNGKADCKRVCPDGEKEGLNDKLCERQGSYWSVAQHTCAKDDEGDLYISENKTELCAEEATCTNATCSKKLEDSCQKGQSRCKGALVETCGDNGWESGENCEQLVGGGAQSCFVVNSTAACHRVCPDGEKEGLNDRVCEMQGAYWSVAQHTCAKDDNAALYISNSTSDLCDEGVPCDKGMCVILPEETCSQEDATRCKGEVYQVCHGGKWGGYDCTQQVGGAPLTCITADGFSSCRVMCPEQKTGLTKEICEMQGAYWGVTQHTCAQDDAGKYYSVSDDNKLCEENEICENAICKKEEDTSCVNNATRCNGKVVEICTNNSWGEKENCELLSGGYGASGCFSVEGNASCRVMCPEGQKEGLNDGVCTMRGSGMSVVKFTCSQDDYSGLYVSDMQVVKNCEQGELCSGATCYKP